MYTIYLLIWPYRTISYDDDGDGNDDYDEKKMKNYLVCISFFPLSLSISVESIGIFINKSLELCCLQSLELLVMFVKKC